MSIDSNLGNKMRALAATVKDPDDLPKGFLRAASRFEEVYRGFYLSAPQTVTLEELYRAYGKAKMLMNEMTGEHP